MAINIRTINKSDISAITAIYNYYIENTTITFEENCLTEKEMAIRVEQISLQFPFLVAETEGMIIGYAYATKWKERSAYRFSAETTVYLQMNQRGNGVGSMLLSALIIRLKELKLHTLIAGIALPNQASIALHEKFGFVKVACFKEVGYKFKKWVDVEYLQLIL